MILPRTLAAIGLLLSAQALPADEEHSHALAAYTAGHGDIGVGWHDGELELHLHLHEGAVLNGVALTEDAEPHADETLIIVSDAARQTATAAISAGTGVAEGAPLWILPTAENPLLPFLGVATEELEPADWTGDIHFKVKDVHSPSGSGHFSVYQSDGLGGFDFHVSTVLGGLTEDDKFSLQPGAHDHFFIAFSEPGLWEVTIQTEGEHSTEGVVESAEVTFLFHVGPFRWTAGHGDIGLAYEGGELELHLHLHEDAVVNDAAQEADSEPPADQTVIVVSEAAQQVATAAIASGAGVSEGGTVWILPTAPNAELPFLGFGTEELEPAEWESNLTFSLVSVSSPSGTGHFSVYQSDGLGGFDFVMSTALGGITEDDHFEMPAGTHDHSFVAFSEPGLWAVTLKASGEHHDDGEVESDEVTFYFEVAEETAGCIALSQAAYTYNQGSTLATVTLNRTGAVTATSVTVNTSNGTAQTTNPPFAAGVAGTDFTALTAPATTVDFAEGETSKTVDIALLPRTGNVPNTRFNVTLSNPTNDVSLGLASAEVRVLANDSMNPTVRIAAPAANASLSLTAPVETRGTAGDKNGILRVEVVLNGGAPVEAELDEDSRPNAVYWHADIIPAEGANTLEVTSFDMSGNASTAATRSFTFSRRWLLAVGRFELHHDDDDHAHDGDDGHGHGDGSGHLDPGDEAGTLMLATLPRTASTALTPRDSHLQSSQVLPGTMVALAAKAKSGYLFSHWEGVPAGANIQGATIAFVMPAANVPRIRAVFAENPFFGLGTRASFLGLLHPEHEEDDTTINSVGQVTGTVVTNTGAFSGKVFIGGETRSFVAVVYASGAVMFNHDGELEPEFEFDGRHMTMDFHDGEFHVHIGGDHDDHHHGDIASDPEDEEIHVAGTLLPAAFSKTSPAPAELPGLFTLSLPSKDQSLPESDYPRGDGFANLTLSSDGKLRTVATLADGTKFTASTELVVEHHHDDHGDPLPADPGEHEDEDHIIAPLFAQLRTPGGGPKDLGGTFAGELAFDTHEEDSDVHGEDLVWIRPAVTELAGTTAAARATQLYTGGWPQGITVDVVGAHYDATIPVQDTLGLGSASPTGNGQLHFAGGKLASDVLVTDFNITGNTAAKLPPTNRSFTLSFTPATGAFKGTFTPNWEDKARALPVFQGILIQKGASQGGYGWFQSNRVGDLDPEAGGVTLGAQE
ncbi:MAG TPA: hypothetical protein DIT64_10955 [Verrucomicrobiales bacterium]|nr:hypothetical protein [Verrucomicrobiales bacterium]